ncbi:MAG TPA: MarR family transcriptional regulator, partial [Burkholderiaceae bacterium]|nr:MarR family transcriptional regulator [Burkholderiaceae bacterium]
MKPQSARSGSLLREVARMYTRAQRVVADCCKTTSTQCHLLGELGRAGPLALSDLGARVMLEKSWVSRAVDAMVERGLVTKEPNPADARSWLVTLTADGERTVADLNRTL